MTTSEELTNLVSDFAGALPDPAAWGIWLDWLMKMLARHE